MKNMIEFLKKHFVLIVCIVIAVAALGAGIWFLVNPGESKPGTSTTESTNGLGVDLNTDIGFGELGNSGIVNVPEGSSPSGEITPVIPEEENNGNSENTSGGTNTPSGGTNTPSGGTNTPSGGTNTPSGDNIDSDVNTGNQTGSQTNAVEMVGGVTANPFK